MRIAHLARCLLPLVLRLILAWGCAAAAHGAEPLRLAASRTPLSLAVFVAQDKGFFAAEGLDVRITECAGGVRCLRMLLDGQADLATASELPIMFNSFTRSDYAVIGTIATTVDDVKLISHARTGIARPQQLQGRRVGAVLGSSSQYFLELYLLTAGVDPRELTVVSLLPEEMPQALASGRVDAIAAWEPHAYTAIKLLGKQAVVLPRAGVYVQTFNLIAQRRMVGASDEALAQLLRAVERAERFIAEQPNAAREILRARLQLDRAFIDWVWPTVNYRLSLDQSLISHMEGEARWALREGHVKAPAVPNLLSLLHAAPLQRVKPEAVGVRR